MTPILVVALGGALGSVARYTLSTCTWQATPGWKFPLGTFLVNVLGCLLVGVLAGAAEKHGLLSPNVRLFLFTGLAGGFTTFSAFGLETFMLLRRGDWSVALAYVSLSLLIGIGALALGFVAVPKPQ